MRTAIIFSTIIALAIGGIIPAVDDRIIGGKETTIEQYPYQVSFRYYGQHNCGGSILNENTIVTAAHCIIGYEYNKLTVMVGNTINYDGEDLELTEIIPHPEFNTDIPLNNDIGILKLAKPLTFSDKVQPISLQSADTPIPEGTIALVSGWGTTVAGQKLTPDELRVVDVSVITNRKCKQMYDSGKITEEMLCAQTAGHDSCQGDSGGPLAANGKLIGVVSWGYGCADPQYPGVYANVSALHEFVDQYL